MIDELIDANGAGCELRSVKNDLLFFGRVYETDGVSVSLITASGVAVPPVIFNTEVKLIVRGLYRRRDPTPLVLFGKVCGSNRSFWKIDRLTPFSFAEQREAYRQKVNLPARALCVNSLYRPEAPSRGKQDAFCMCMLVDISMTGALFTSREHYERGDWLVLVDVRLVKGTVPFVLTCQIRRAEVLTPKETAYGCHFTHLSVAERDRLCRIVFDLQREDISGHRD